MNAGASPPMARSWKGASIPPMLSGKRLYATVAGFYALSRLLLWALGVRFGATSDWQHFADLDLLQHRLWETLFYYHAFTPFMNLLVGGVLGLWIVGQLAAWQPSRKAAKVSPAMATRTI